MLSSSHEFLMHHARDHVARRHAEADVHALLREALRARSGGRRAASLRTALAGLLAGVARALTGAAERLDPSVAEQLDPSLA